MARTLRVLPSVFAMAVGVAPPVVMPPPAQPVSIPLAGVATQTVGTNAGLAAAPMPIASSASSLGSRVPMLATRTGMSEPELMQVLGAVRAKAVGSVQSQSTADVGMAAEQQSFETQLQAVMEPVMAWMSLVGVFLLSGVSAAAANLYWWRKQRGADVMKVEAKINNSLTKMAALGAGFLFPATAHAAAAAFPTPVLGIGMLSVIVVIVLLVSGIVIGRGLVETIDDL